MEGSTSGMKRVQLLIGAVAAASLAGCVGGPARSANPLGNNDPNRDLATQEQFPLQSDPVKEEVIGDAEANRLVNQPMRAPWHL